MFAYYVTLALRSLRRNVVLTALMITAIGVGIAAAAITLTIFRAMSGDPIPSKSAQLYTPQIDNWGPINGQGIGGKAITGTDDGLPAALSYTDALGLMRAHAAARQAAMFRTGVAVTPPNAEQRPFAADVRATYADLFAMFQVPFQYGAPWNAADDEARAPVVVIARALNDRIFGGANSIGRTIRLNSDQYRVVGVIDRWSPAPRFYELFADSGFGKDEQVFMPFSVAVARRLAATSNSCGRNPIGTGEDALLRSECIWIEFWAELPDAASARRYASFLHNYASAQRDSGRFSWPARTALRNVRQWLAYHHVVSSEVRILVAVSFSFLLVCLINAMGLMLAKFMTRAGSVGVRRALGASRGAIFAQGLIEAGIIGLVGGLLGLALTALGLVSSRALLPANLSILTHLDAVDVALAILLAIGATLLAGLYPTWRASRVQPAWQLKTQ
jgi:putative ABC transport system permease protein